MKQRSDLPVGLLLHYSITQGRLQAILPYQPQIQEPAPAIVERTFGNDSKIVCISHYLIEGNNDEVPYSSFLAFYTAPH